MTIVLPFVLVMVAVIWPSLAAAVCGPTWIDSPPTFTYQDAPLRLHFYPDESVGCVYSLGKMDGQTVSVTLEGETEPTLFKVKNVTNGAEFIQDWTPVNGWGGRTEVKLPLDFLCYPRDPEKHGAITFSVQNTAAPAAEKPSLKVGANSQYLGFEFDPADPQFIYWIKITPTDYKWNNGQIPLMISSQSSSGKGAYTQLAGWGESCVWSLYLNPCVEYSVTAFSEDLIGRKSAVSDPVYVTLGTGPDGSFWKMGDPMNCSSGCSCSNVGL